LALSGVVGAEQHSVNARGGRHARRVVASRPWSARLGVWLLALGGLLVVAAGAIVSFELAPAVQRVRSSAPPVQATPNASAPGAAAHPSAVSPSPASLAGEFAELQRRLHAKTGVVLRPVGAGAEGSPTALGAWNSGPAWSTIKVPLVIAAMRQQDTNEMTKPMIASITESDNAAAELLWESLGDPATAATKVGSVLRETGDPTVVQSQKVRPEYTAFGDPNRSGTPCRHEPCWCAAPSPRQPWPARPH
jgi:beta-lactamase class A